MPTPERALGESVPDGLVAFPRRFVLIEQDAVKPHVIIKLAPSVSPVPVAHWTAILDDKASAATTLHPAVDAVFERHGAPVWVTREYAPSSGDAANPHAVWSPEERASGFDRTYRLILHHDRGLPAGLVDAVRVLPAVQSAEPGRVAQADLPVATATSRSTSDWARAAIGLPDAHRVTRGHPDVTVAVLDTGLWTSHPEYADRLRPGRDFVNIIDGADAFIGDYLEADADPTDEVGHGTHVAGIVAGAGRAMPPGVAPRCSLLPVRVLGAMKSNTGAPVGAGLVDNINVGLKWAVDQGADVLNMSLGIRHTGGGLPHEDVVAYARRKGVTLVAASGNDGTDTLYYPGALPHVITVGATDAGGRVTPFSTYGRQVDLVAPGEAIYSTHLNNGYAFSTGTSHAAPFVAGAIALLKADARTRGRRLSDGAIKHLLAHTADKVDRRFKHPRAGFGRLNVRDALRLLDHQLTQPSSRSWQTNSPRSATARA